MRIGEICGAFGSRIENRIRDYKMESKYEGFKTTTYHRRTHVFDSCWGLQKEVKSSKKSWIAVQSHENIFIMPHDIALEESDLSKIFSCFTREPQAVVSFILDTNEFHNGSGIAASLAECQEIKAISFLKESLSKCSDLNDEEAMLITMEAFRMFSGDIETNELKPFVQARNRSLSKEIDSQDANYESKREKRKYEEIRVGCNRETQIWCGGWDSQLHSAQFRGFNWIAVQGKDSVCVVTQDEVGMGFLKDLSYHMEVYPLFARRSDADQSLKRSFMMSPFAVVSVKVGLNKVDAESHSEALIAEVEAVEFLAKQIKNGPSFTFVVTIQTAIDALIRLVPKDRNKDIQVCVLRKGMSPVKERIPFNEIGRVNEIVKHLPGRMKPRKHKHDPEE